VTAHPVRYSLFFGPDNESGRELHSIIYTTIRRLFSHQKEKSGIFFAAKIFAGPGDPDFFGKIRNFRKIHDGEKNLQFIVNPVSG